MNKRKKIFAAVMIFVMLFNELMPMPVLYAQEQMTETVEEDDSTVENAEEAAEVIVENSDNKGIQFPEEEDRFPTKEEMQKYCGIAFDEEELYSYESSCMVPVASGRCGTSLTWSVEDDTLTISGTGAMYNYTKPLNEYEELIEEPSFEEQPWKQYRNVKNIVLTDGITDIGMNAFNGFWNVEEIIVPEGVTVIGEGAFANCYKLEHIKLPASFTSLRFKNDDETYGVEYDYLTSGHVPLFVSSQELKTAGPSGGDYNIEFGWTETIPAYIFEYSGLTAITLPDELKNIEKGAFKYSDLEECIIPDGAETVGEEVFSRCYYLKHLVIPGSVTTFNGQPDSTSMKTAGPIGGGYDLEYGWTEDIPDRAFYNWTYKDISYDEEGQTIVFPQTLKSIGQEAFYGCCLKDVRLSASVNSIGTSAFGGNSYLEHVEISSKSLACDYSVFSGADNIKTAGPLGSGCDLEFGLNESLPKGLLNGLNLTYLRIPGIIKTIESGAIPASQALKTAGPIGGGYNIEFGWKDRIPEWAFSGTDVEEVLLPEGIGGIGNCAFMLCRNLKKINLPNSLKDIGGNAFQYCEKLEGDFYPEGLTYIGRVAFENCTKLSGFHVPGNGCTIGEKAFSGCTSLSTVLLDEGVESIGDGAFYNCAALTEIELPLGLKTFYKSALIGTAVKKLKYPYTLTTVYGSSSSSTVGMLVLDELEIENETYTLSEGILDNSYSSYYGNGASIIPKSLIIPESLTYISAGAIRDCVRNDGDSLTDIYYGGSQKRWSRYLQIDEENDDLSSVTMHYAKTNEEDEDDYGVDDSKYYTLFFETNGGSPVPPTRWKEGKTFPCNVVTHRIDYIFMGWYFDEELTQPVDTENTVVTQDIKVYAKWMSKWNRSNESKGPFEESAYFYNNGIALMASDLSKTAEDATEKGDENILRDKYKEYGFENYTIDIVDNNEPLSYSIAFREMKGYWLVVVTARGSKKWSEYINDNFAYLESIDIFDEDVYDYPEEFEEKIYQGLIGYFDLHKELQSGRVKFLLTGHSLGGAAINLLAARLTAYADGKWRKTSDCFRYSSSHNDIYCYTFGALNSITRTRTDFANIHNIYNFYDTFGPNGAFYLKEPCDIGSMRGKYGHLHLFGTQYNGDLLVNPVNHIMQTYIDALNGKTNRYALKTNCEGVYASTRCPVDITVLKNGVIVGKITDNVVDEGLTEIPMFVDGTEKYYWLPDKGDYEIIITATGEGTMQHTVYGVDGDEMVEKTYVDVALVPGKVMSDKIMIGEEEEINIGSLYVLDENGKAVKEIGEDGTETEVITYSVNFDLNGKAGSAPETQTITAQKTAAEPSPAPTAIGWIFTGWYKEAECINIYDFATPVTADITLYAGWKKAEDTETYVAMTGFTLDKSVAELREGEKLTLVITFTPDNATNKKVTWSTSDASVATVEAGVVTAVKEGKAIIKAVSEDGNHEAVCEVTVKSKEVPESPLNPEVPESPLGPDKADLSGYTASGNEIAVKSINLKKTIFKGVKGIRKLGVTSGDSASVKIKGSTLTVLKDGTVTVAAFNKKKEKLAEKTLTLIAPTINTTLQTEITRRGNLDLNKYISSTVKPSAWKSSSKKIAEVSQDGLLTMKKSGKVKITVTFPSEKGMTAKKLTIKLKITMPQFKKTAYTVKAGKTISTSVKNATASDISYRIEDTGIATVDAQGRVTGVSKGTTKLIMTVKSIDYETKIKVK